MPDYLQVKNWDKFQHYKDRRPPWVKLHESLLDDYEFCMLSDATRGHLMLIWLLAARVDNKITNDQKWIRMGIKSHGAVDIDGLIQSGFLEEWHEEESEEWASRYIPQDVRNKVLSDGENKCSKCGRKKNLEIDHIVPVSKGGDGSIRNLQVLCRSCNRKKRACVASRYTDTTSVRSVETEAEAEVKAEVKTKTEAEKSNARVQKEPGKSGTPRQSSLEPPILTILLRGQTKTWNLTAEVLVQHIEAYPALDVLSEFKHIRGWSERMSLTDREVKGWTSRGVLAGIRRWFEKEVESPTQNGAHGRQSWTKDERWKAFRKVLPDWPKEKLRWACMTAKERMEHEVARIEGDEQDQDARAAAAGKRKSSGGPVAIGTLAGENLRRGTE